MNLAAMYANLARGNTHPSEYEVVGIDRRLHYAGACEVCGREATWETELATVLWSANRVVSSKVFTRCLCKCGSVS